MKLSEELKNKNQEKRIQKEKFFAAIKNEIENTNKINFSGNDWSLMSLYHKAVEFQLIDFDSMKWVDALYHMNLLFNDLNAFLKNEGFNPQISYNGSNVSLVINWS